MKALCTKCNEIVETSIELDLAITVRAKRPQDMPKVNSLLTIACKSCGYHIVEEEGTTTREEAIYS